MSPIRVENRDRYPADWPAISHRIRFERAAGRCECDGRCGHDHDGRCTARHGEPHPVTGSVVVLTVAHLRSATRLPVDLHVTRAAEADEVVEVVGRLVPVDPEGLERDDVVHDRSLAEFLGGPSASSARFVIALPGGASSGTPAGSVVAGSAPGPEWVVLTGWGEGGEVREPAGVAAEATPGGDVEAGDLVGLAARLADGGLQAALRSADEFSATGFRARAHAVRGLLSRDRHLPMADGALDGLVAAALRAADAGALDASTEPAVPSSGAGVGAGEPSPLRVVWERLSALDAGLGERASSWAGHRAELYHLDHHPENCDDENLMAACQRCHLAYDRHLHTANARRSRDERRGQLTLPGGAA